MSPAAIAQAQLDAYNAQDLDAYCGFFTDDIVVADLNGTVTTQGAQAYREVAQNLVERASRPKKKVAKKPARAKS